MHLLFYTDIPLEQIHMADLCPLEDIPLPLPGIHALVQT
jgi:hypothetical protein